MKTEFKKGLKQGFSLPGFAMGSAMIGFGALAYESNLDYFVTIASMLFLWSMPGMILFVTLISSGASIILMLNAKDKIYIVTIVFSGFLLIVSYPFLGDWSILTSGLLSAIPGYVTGRFLKIWQSLYLIKIL